MNFTTPRAKIRVIAAFLKKSGKKIVTWNGSFDILHAGHLAGIREAKQQGDVLIILVNSDRSVRAYKGPNRPIVPQNERAEMLAALADVDYVVIFDELTPIKILSEIKPYVHCNGSDWGKNCVERAVVEENGGRIHILKWVKGLSTSDIVRKIMHAEKNPAAKAIFTDMNFSAKDAATIKRKGYEFIKGKSAHSIFIKTGRKMGLSLADSWLIAEKPAEVVAGRNVNLKTIKLGEIMPKKLKLEPHYYAKDLKAALAIILK